MSFHSSDGENVSLVDSDEEAEVEDGIRVDDVDAVTDHFDPFEGPIWEDQCDNFDNYLAKLYRNGELYIDKGFWNIVINEWQLFTDKKHLRDVIKDYCIQSGFSVIVDKANTLRYTARCSYANCEWRLHASRLADGVTCAIKKIQNPEHTCLGLKTKNPMVTVKWACNVLLEDIRANNDIPGRL